MIFNQSIVEIFKILSQNPKLNLHNSDAIRVDTSIGINLLYADESILTTIVPNFWNTFSQIKSKLIDQLIDLNNLNFLIKNMTDRDQIVRLNHIGFCYKTTSSDKEMRILIEAVKKLSIHLYQEESNSDDVWLFAGDIKKKLARPLN